MKKILHIVFVIIIIFFMPVNMRENENEIDSISADTVAELQNGGVIKEEEDTTTTKNIEDIEDTEDIGYTDEITFDTTDLSDISNISGISDMNDFTSPVETTDLTDLTDLIEITNPISIYPAETTEIFSIAETTKNNILTIPIEQSLIPYTLDEIKNMFSESRALFEKVKDICLSTGYYTSILVSPNIAYESGIIYRGANQANYVDVSEIEGHEAITELFNKYNILSVNSYDYDDHYTQKRESAIIFQMSESLTYEQWICYSVTAFITGTVPDEFTPGKMKLDDNWYYERYEDMLK